MSALKLPALSILLLLLMAVGWKALPGRTTPITTGPAPIAVLERVSIGGMEQWLLIRGQDRSAPVLLWLHGGPGAAQMPLAHVTTRALEREFIVVHWDQRGAGKSNPPDFDESTMDLERFLLDAHEVTQYLKDRLGVEQIVVLGHSWGTMLGTRLVARWPEDYAAYIGVGQQVSTTRGIVLALEWLRPRIQERGHRDHLSFLAEATLETLLAHPRYVALMRLVEAYGGGMNASLLQLALNALQAREYNWVDYARWLHGANRGSGPMWPDYRSRELFAEVPMMPVPMFLISGAHDMNTPHALTQAHFAFADAPMGKRFFTFEDSGHAPFFSEPQRFLATLREIRATIDGGR